jgi:hypothetical protein
MYEHKVLRLPPYHPDPIEKIWANVKGWTATRNVTCNLNDVENLARGRFGQITTDDWIHSAHMQEIGKKNSDNWRIFLTKQ